MSDVPTARMIRLYCDGELAAEEAEKLEEQLRRDAEQQGRVDFERRLREHVDEAIKSSCGCVPSGLAERIRERLSAAGEQEAEAAPDRFSIAAWLQGPRRVNTFAVAACLALVAGAVLFGIFGSPIDTWSRPQPADLVAKAIPFVSGEHVRCADSAASRAEKTTFHVASEVGVELTSWLGAPVRAVPLTNSLRDVGWSFLGGGYCGVPVKDRSGHLIFTRDDLPGGPIMLSVFVLPDDGYAILKNRLNVPIEPGQWHQLAADERFSREVWVFSDGRLIYLMVACRPSEMPEAAAALERGLAR